MVAGSVTLNEMTRYLPQNMEELAQISGFGKARLGAYGERFLEVINRYCEIHQIGSLIHEKLPKSKGSAKKTGLTETKSETFQLYKSGKSVAEIAARRNFKIETIEGHLVYYVQTGEIKIDELLSSEKINLIEPLVKNFEGSSLTTIKQQLGDAVTYNDIRLMLAWCSREKSHV
jgi:ATP-dependent DNA helicase RecQ